MDEISEVVLTLMQGPICGLGDAGVAASYPLWDSIVATERFPPNVGAAGANYILTVKKGVSDSGKVRCVEDELTKALKMLAAAWPFSGGSNLAIQTRETVRSSGFTSNADELERQLLERNGLRRLTGTANISLEISATYLQFPLKFAVCIARKMRCDPGTYKLMQYHQTAVNDRSDPGQSDGASWFISLYKIRDILKLKYGGELAARAALGISEAQWSKFGKILNKHDLRHAEIREIVPPISRRDQDMLYQTAFCWVASYLRAQGL